MMKKNIPLMILFALTFASVCGCEAAIGDKCSSSNECPTGTICDTDSPSGYCLAYGCASDEECPEDATCVEFAPDITYCLKRCKNAGNCRSGYTCRDDIGENKFCYVEPESTYGRDENNKIDFVPPENTSSDAADNPSDDQQSDNEN
jgi:hypothetical protein